MELAAVKNLFNRKTKMKKGQILKVPNLTNAQINHSYVIKKIETQEKAMTDFLFSLGCYEGEEVTVISVLAQNYIIHVKNARYSIDEELARVILI
ncbi:MAG: hypothetical protein PWR12_1215 [Eubacteriaceae bacterium]|jgi:ferrous iron transport protein A|nr:hypothetical protein [Eubacteriaceae bacterium]